MRERTYKHKGEYLKLPYEYLERSPQIITPDWIKDLSEGENFVVDQSLTHGYKYIDPQLVSDPVYELDYPSRLFLDFFNEIYEGGIYKLLKKSRYPSYTVFEKHKVKAPLEIDLTVIEPVLLPSGARYVKHLIGFLNHEVTSPSTPVTVYRALY